MIFKLLGGSLLLAVVAVGAVFLLAKQQPDVAAGLKPVAPSTQAAQSFDAKLNALQVARDVARRTGTGQAVEVTFTEQELTSKASQVTGPIGDTGIAATDTQVHLAGGNVVATSTLTVQGISVNVGVVATPTVVNGRMQLVVTDVQTGSLPLPDAIKKQISAAVGQAIDPSTLGLPFNISDLTIIDGKIVLKGTAKP